MALRHLAVHASTALCALLLAASPAHAQPRAPAPPAALPVHAPQVPQAQRAAQQPQTPAEARKLSDAFVQVADRVSPSVVQIDVTAREEPDAVMKLFGRGGDSPIARGTGSGVVFTPDGAILTNNHVIESALSIGVRLRDGRFLPATLVGRDPGTDLAVIRVDAKGLPAARFADSDAARVGEWVVAIGSPFGLGYSVTTGVLSAKGRGGLGMNVIEDYLQTDASINPGNSGGPLCDLEGRVLGVNTMIVGRGSGIGFAVPSNMARRVAEQLLRTGKVERAWIGVGIQDLTPELAAAMRLDAGAGALVNSVNPDGPAQRSNLKPGDVIAAVDGKAVHDGRELIREVIAREVGKVVPLEVLREGKRYTSQITLAARPEPRADALPMQRPATPPSGLGLTVRDLTAEQAAAAGLRPKPIAAVAALVPGSAADRAGLKAGDVIVEVDGHADPTAVHVQEAARDGQILVRLKRKTASFYAVVKRQ
ncbi:MAG: trypsin-like peptidase domain-containing protein [Myxococcales bacterium]|jgi:S1-C subfamily serine protease|nr:trypsin-like peptidase domain-containing protein [Myxococcales bacterium]